MCMKERGTRGCGGHGRAPPVAPHQTSCAKLRSGLWPAFSTTALCSGVHLGTADTHGMKCKAGRADLKSVFCSVGGGLSRLNLSGRKASASSQTAGL